jgi:glycosyltransferase involved in cell wall biosynthesis
MNEESNHATKERGMLSVVAGAFNEEENIEEFLTRVHAALAQIPDFPYEIIIIDNASTDGTLYKLKTAAAQDKRLKVIVNARNFGHIRSPYHAFLQTSGDAVIYLASDLQDPPEMIPDLVAAWQRGAKAVVAIKDSSDEAGVFFFLRKMYYRLVEKLADVRTFQNFTGFGLYDRQIVDYCRGLHDPYPYFRGIIAEIGLPVEEVHYHQPKRPRGITKNNFYTLYDMAMLGITNHSKIPLRLATMSGFLMSLFALMAGLGYLILKLLLWQQFPIGIAPLVIGLFLFASVQLFFIGILGEYIGAIHTQVLKRPLVVEKERINF